MGNSPSGKDGEAAPPEPPKEPGMFTQLSMGYDQLVNAIIRPPRAQYDLRALGPEEFSFQGRKFARADFDLLNDREMTLKCSHWTPTDPPLDRLPCVIYLHGNSSCRAEAVNVLSPLLSGGMTVLAFDFAGSGQSDGEYVSLGFFEKEDLACVVEYLRQSGRVSTLGLWGRSMGAATALQHGDRDPSIAGMVIDSGFTSLEVLARELVDIARQQGHTIPGFAVSIAMSMIKSSVKKKAKFKVESLTPIEHVDRCFIPAIFVHGKGDNFILPHHSEEMCEQYAGEKQLMIVDGDHNSARPPHILDTAAIFLHNALQVKPECCPDLQGEYPVLPGLPPWRQHGGGMHSMEFEDFVMSRRPIPAAVPQSHIAPTKESVADQVVAMVEMGFEAEQAEAALLQNYGNVDLALAAILEGDLPGSESPVLVASPVPDPEEDAPNPDRPVPDLMPAGDADAPPAYVKEQDNTG